MGVGHEGSCRTLVGDGCAFVQPAGAQPTTARLTWPSSEWYEPTMLKGLETAVYFVADLAAARDWYRKVLGIEPNYDTPYYVGFTVAGDELGLHPLEDGAGRASGNQQTAYWSVDDIDSAVAHFVEHGAELEGTISDVGGGIRIGAVRDPFGNAFGLIQNPKSPNR